MKILISKQKLKEIMTECYEYGKNDGSKIAFNNFSDKILEDKNENT
jgi:hypothetical protein